MGTVLTFIGALIFGGIVMWFTKNIEAERDRRGD